MEHKGQITIKDIARELGISPSTVSRALKNHPDISSKTKELVHELAKRYNYKPNAVALSLRSSKTHMIGVIIPKVVHFFFSSVISGIEHVANELGYNVMICQSDENEDREITSIQSLTSARVDGILASVSKDTTDFIHYKELLDNNIPLVFFDRALAELKTDKVVIDDVDGAFIATEHLILKGCKKIVHLAAPQNLLIGQRRREGYLKALNKHGIPVDENLIRKCDSREEALIVMREIYDSGIRPDGVFAVNDLTASGVLKVVKQYGYSVPHDVKVVGFSDGFVATVTDPTLTTIDQHGFEMGKQAAQLLLDRINKTIDNYSPITKIIPTNLIVRESTGI
ncbi:MAG: LacI family transcriptional regulator [Bacteroidetes bacterium HGW-Bacteroidetes-4]|jgi:LacI family transcriptional regulator|nr:MAG: LacI family transcriptional regulator [Bacteroidetes bacterium HGW-Bacteroidetes-4]